MESVQFEMFSNKGHFAINAMCPCPRCMPTNPGSSVLLFAREGIAAIMGVFPQNEITPAPESDLDREWDLP